MSINPEELLCDSSTTRTAAPISIAPQNFVCRRLVTAYDVAGDLRESNYRDLLERDKRKKWLELRKIGNGLAEDVDVRCNVITNSNFWAEMELNYG